MSAIRTLSGKFVDLAHPKPETIDHADIAVGLARAPRFVGQTYQHYSVAQHSVECAKLVPLEFELHALLHDATEAYMGDCSGPLKALLGDAWSSIEHRLHVAICEKFGVSIMIPDVVKWADKVMRVTENRDLQPDLVRFDGVGYPPPREATVIPLPCEQARALWLNSLRKALRRFEGEH